MKKVSKDKKYQLMKTIIVISVYLVYSFVFNSLAGMFNITKSIIVSFTGDIFFLVFILIMYKDKLLDDMHQYHKNNVAKKRMIITGSWVLIIFIVNVLGGFLGSLISDNNVTANNIALFSLPYLYTFFKTLIFGSIAEELVFKQSLRDVVDNNILFLIVSTLLYTTLNIAYTNLTGLDLIANMIPYALFAILSGILYIRHKNNIYVVITVKICYNLIPFVIMLLGGVG